MLGLRDGDMRIKCHSQLHSRFKLSQCYMRPCLNKRGLVCLRHDMWLTAGKSGKGAHVALCSS